MILLRLYWEFFKVGLFAVGGGLATLPFLQQMSYSTAWFTLDDLANMLAVSESTPGPIGVNMATYVGFSVGGIPGAVLATLGLISPSIIIVLLIAAVLKNYRHNKYVERVFYGLRPASVALIVAAAVSLTWSTLFDPEGFAASGLSPLHLLKWPELLLAVLLLVFSCWIKQSKNLHPIIFIAAAAVVGVVFHLGGV